MGLFKIWVFGAITFYSVFASANLVCTSIFTMDAASSKPVPQAPANIEKPQQPQFQSVHNLHYSGRLLNKATNKRELNEALYMLVESANRIMDDIVEIAVEVRAKPSLSDAAMRPYAESINELMTQLRNAFEVEAAPLEAAIFLRIEKYEREEAARIEAQKQRGPIGYYLPKKQGPPTAEAIRELIMENLRRMLSDTFSEPVERGPLGFTAKTKEATDASDAPTQVGPIGFRTKKVEVEEGPIEKIPMGFTDFKNSGDAKEPTVRIYLNPETGLFDFIRVFEEQ